MNKTSILGWVVAIIVIVGFGFYFIGRNTVDSMQNPVVPTNTTTAIVIPATEKPVVASQPATPTTPTITTDTSVVTSDTTAIESASVMPNGALTNYWYEYGITASLGNKTSLQAVGSGYEAIPAPAYITGLAPNTTYYIRIVSQNKFGTVNGSQYQFHTTQGNQSPVGSAPTTQTNAASLIARTTVTLNGQVTPNSVYTSYWFEYGTSVDLGNTSTLSPIGNGNVASAVSVSVSNLMPQTTYYYRVNAENQFGIVNGTILNFQTTGPKASTAPSASTRNVTDVGTSTATLRGSVTPNGDTTTFWFEYQKVPFSSSVTPAITTSQTLAGLPESFVANFVSMNVYGLSRGTTYYVRIAAQNSAGIVRGVTVNFKTK